MTEKAENTKASKSKGGIKGVTEVFDEIFDDWPTNSLKNTLWKLKPEEGAEVYLKMNEGDHDLTEQCLQTEERFRPDITIRTRELKTELNRWKIGGGAFFRVVGDAPTEEKAMKLCLQYFIIWTRQLFPFQFFFLSIPFFVTPLFLWQFCARENYYPIPTNQVEVYLTLLITGLVFVFLGAWTAVEGFYRKYIQGIKNWKVVPDSMIGYVVCGILLWTTALEYAITDIVNGTGFPALIPISGWVSIALGIIIVAIGADFYLRGTKSFVERFSHPMDYAPLMVYLIRDEGGDWKIDGTQFDYFHYKTSFASRDSLVFHEYDRNKEHPRMLIDRSWHAFREYIRPNIFYRIFSNLILELVILVLASVFYVANILNKFHKQGDITIEFLNNPVLQRITSSVWFYQLAYVVIPIFLVLLIWSNSRTVESKMFLWEELYQKEGADLIRHHHLSYDRLRVLWNLRDRAHKVDTTITSLWAKGGGGEEWIEGDKARLVARVKLQYPFDRYRHWHTIRDTQEELLSLIALETKERELEELQEQIEKAKSQLLEQKSSIQKAQMDSLEQ